MKRRITIGLGVPVTVGLMAIASALHSPTGNVLAVSSTPPPPPSIIPTPISPPPAPPTMSPTPAPPTATTVPATEVPATATSAPAETPTPTPKPAAPTAKPTTPPAPTSTPPPPGSTPIPTFAATATKPGGGGTYVYGSTNAGRVASTGLHSNLPGSANSTNRVPAGGTSQLPRTGGGNGSDPSAPLGPLALLGALAIAAGRFLPRLIKR